MRYAEEQMQLLHMLTNCHHCTQQDSSKIYSITITLSDARNHNNLANNARALNNIAPPKKQKGCSASTLLRTHGLNTREKCTSMRLFLLRSNATTNNNLGHLRPERFKLHSVRAECDQEQGDLGSEIRANRFEKKNRSTNSTRTVGTIE